MGSSCANMNSRWPKPQAMLNIAPRPRNKGSRWPKLDPSCAQRSPKPAQHPLPQPAPAPNLPPSSPLPQRPWPAVGRKPLKPVRSAMRAPSGPCPSRAALLLRSRKRSRPPAEGPRKPRAFDILLFRSCCSRWVNITQHRHK